MQNDFNPAGCFAVLGCFVLPAAAVVAFVWWGLWARGKVKREAKVAYAAYQESLGKLRSDPTNALLREEALQRGRAYMYLARMKRGVFPVDEIEIGNDINAACAGAARAEASGRGASIEERLRRLDALKAQGQISDDEYNATRSRILAEV